MADNKLPSPPSYDTGTFSANDSTNTNYNNTYSLLDGFWSNLRGNLGFDLNGKHIYILDK